MDLDHGWLIRRNNWAAGLFFFCWLLALGLNIFSWGSFTLADNGIAMLPVYFFAIGLHLVVFLPLPIAVHVQVSSLRDLVLKNTDDLAKIANFINDCIETFSTIDI